MLLWLLINCNSLREAKTIGQSVLKHRLASCFDVLPRQMTAYFWPPKRNRIETGKGYLLVLVTFPSYVLKIRKLVKRLHSDQLPFIGSVKVGHVEPRYLAWAKGELAH